MDLHLYAMQIRRGAMALALLEAKRKRPFSPDTKRMQSELLALDTELDRMEKGKRAS